MNIKNCKDNQIYNIKTKRCVNKNGKTGKKLLILNETIFLFWEKNSCYIDSLLVSLFHNKNKIIEKEIFNVPLVKYDKSILNNLCLEIKNELYYIYNIISQRLNNKINKCTNLRKLINNFYSKLIYYYPNKSIIEYNENWINSQLDIFDLLNLLSYIFDFNNSLKIKEENNIINTHFNYNIPIDLLLNKKKLYINKIIPSFKIKNNKKIYKTTLLKSNLLFIKIFRNMASYKLDTKIIPSKIIKLPNNSFNLYLSSILIHYGSYASGHYICLYYYNNNWFEYNDLNKKSSFIGKFNKIINNDDYISNIVGLIYQKYI